MKRFLEKRGLWLLLAIAVVAVTLAAMSILSSTASPLGNLVGVITSPFRSAAQSVADWYNEKQDYFADNRALRAANEELKRQIAEDLKPSARGEYEITDVNKEYLKCGELKVRLMSRGFAWLDTGTHQSLADATNVVRAIVERQGLQLSCIEEIAWNKGWIDDAQLKRLADGYGKSTYGAYLRQLAG